MGTSYLEVIAGNELSFGFLLNRLILSLLCIGISWVSFLFSAKKAAWTIANISC